ncbi:DUF3293 domain-containing protein [Tenacibaculum sp. C7A-26P2]|uniref:DUF3293 domain-containing protein n=1 Tax=Tenacibaculum sp. C7A-26P2 TaxID=3447504 RepID=UPI003F825A05
MNEFLQKAYMETTYQIVGKKDTYKLRLDTLNHEFNIWCKKCNIKSWAFITAFNPFSNELSKFENELLNSQLQKIILKEGYNFNLGKGVPANDNWSAEESFFIHNITLSNAKKIGIQFNQNAIVFGDSDNLQKLIWLV